MSSIVDNTDGMSFGDVSFQITTANEMMLSALITYSKMLDYVTNATGDEQLNIDGLINSLLADGMNRRIKELVKKHSFEDAKEFMDCMAECHDGEEAFGEIRQHEANFYQKTHDEILSHIPVDDGQLKLPLVEVTSTK